MLFKTLDTPNLTGMSINVSCDRGIVGELTKLKYDGKTCVRSFIQKLDEFRISKGISEEKMLLSAIDVFVGDALHWYRSIRDRVQNWRHLIACLKEDFDTPDYDYQMAAEIRQRTQGEDESITVYLAIMEGMFSRLSKPLDDEAKLEIVLHNIRPCYAIIIAASSSVKSIGELRIICKNYEGIKVRAENFKEPPFASSTTLAPEFSYQSSKRKNTNTQNAKFYGRANQFDSQRRFEPAHAQSFKTSEIQTSEISKKPYCHRCRVDTHYMKDCTAERVIFCFKCGKKDVRTPDCPVCNPKN